MTYKIYKLNNMSFMKKFNKKFLNNKVQKLKQIQEKFYFIKKWDHLYTNLKQPQFKKVYKVPAAKTKTGRCDY